MPKICALGNKSVIVLLIELYEDVERWRDTGGDPRDLRYILDTLEKIDPAAVAELSQSLPNIPEAGRAS